MAEPTAHTEHPAGHSAFPPFQSEFFPSQLVWLAISFVLALRADVAGSRCRGSARSWPSAAELIGDDLTAAERLKEQSNAAQMAYEKSLADARSRAQSIANSTRDQQAAAAEASHKQLEAKLHEQLAAAEQSIAATRTAAMGNVRSIASDTAAAIVERLIGKAPADHEVAAALDAGKS